MKKTFSLAAMLLIATVSISQDTIVKHETIIKNRTAILPEAKSWAVGIEVNQLLKYAGDLFSNRDGEQSGFGFTRSSNNAISVLHVKNENTIYRIKFRFAVIANSVDSIRDNESTQNTEDKVTDTRKETTIKEVLSFGYQKSRGSGRLRGIYGADAMIGSGSSTTKYAYGFALSDSAQNGGNQRLLQQKSGTTFSFGLRAFLGAEYFFAAKMSVSGEFGYGFLLSTTGEGETKTEIWDVSSGSSGKLKTITSKSGKSSSFALDTDNLDGGITLHFYF